MNLSLIIGQALDPNIAILKRHKNLQYNIILEVTWMLIGELTWVRNNSFLKPVARRIKLHISFRCTVQGSWLSGAWLVTKLRIMDHSRLLSIATTAADEFLAMLLNSSTEESVTDWSDDHTVKLDIDLSIRNDTNHWPVAVPLPSADANVTLTCID